MADAPSFNPEEYNFPMQQLFYVRIGSACFAPGGAHSMEELQEITEEFAQHVNGHFEATSTNTVVIERPGQSTDG
ncbi:MAG: hypothetical protein J0L97_03805 [Alphaproteobacteria bacterium]|nr:hypothetical protein [Alphaproteobacteria bacterium]